MLLYTFPSLSIYPLSPHSFPSPSASSLNTHSPVCFTYAIYPLIGDTCSSSICVFTLPLVFYTTEDVGVCVGGRYWEGERAELRRTQYIDMWEKSMWRDLEKAIQAILPRDAAGWDAVGQQESGEQGLASLSSSLRRLQQLEGAVQTCPSSSLSSTLPQKCVGGGIADTVRFVIQF